MQILICLNKLTIIIIKASKNQSNACHELEQKRDFKKLTIFLNWLNINLKLGYYLIGTSNMHFYFNRCVNTSLIQH